MGNILRHNDSDTGLKFRRHHWDTDLFFSWFPPLKRYEYNNGYRVGKQVLEYTDIVEIKTKKEKKMNKNYIGTGYQVVRVSYELSENTPTLTTYTFKTSIKLVVGDLVVVDGVKGLAIVRVVQDSIERSLDTETIKEFNKAKAWVVNKVDTADHTARKEATERKKFIMSQLAERREAMEEVAIYKLLADSDPEAAKLLTELENLND